MTSPLPISERPMRTGSRLERALRAGRFAITSELHAPDSADPADVYRHALDLAAVVDAINATDGSGANCHMSSVGCCALLAQTGYDVVLQVGCRDRNRIAIQGDLLGAAGLGVKNVLCLTGDDVSVGDQPEAKRVFDLDSIHLLQVARMLRDQGVFLSGRKLITPPRFFLGAASNPFVPPLDWRPHRLAKKIEAGAEFIQTQYCYDIPRFKQFMQWVRDMGLPEQAYIMVGVGPLRSEKAAEFMRTKVPGIWIPDEVVERMAKTPKSQKKQEGVRLCAEIIQQVREIEGVSGVHIMAYGMEETVPDIVEQAGLLPLRRPKDLARHRARQLHPSSASAG